MEWKEIAQVVLSAVGGEENIQHVEYCSTRLRINVSDVKKVNTEVIKKLSGIVGVNISGKQLQIIIGTDVGKMYRAFNEIIAIPDVPKSCDIKKSGSIINILMDTIAGAFTPLLPAITGAGMIKAVLAILTTFSIITTESQNYYILNLISDAVFYFLPIMLAYTMAKQLECNIGVAMSLGAILVHPSFTNLVTAGDPVHFIGLPIRLVSYSSSVIPVLLIVWFMSYVEKFLDKIIPNIVKQFLKPLLELIICATAGLVVIGPLGSICGDGLLVIVNFLSAHLGWFLVALLAATMPLITMTGMHYALLPVVFATLASVGYDNLLIPAVLAANVGQGAAALTVAFFKNKNDEKQIAVSAGLTAFCGITEPAMYGVNFKYKKPFWAAMIGAGCAGLYAGIIGVKAYAFGAVGLIGIPLFMNNSDIMNAVNAVIVCAITIVVTVILTIVFMKREKKEEQTEIEKVLPVVKKGVSEHFLCPMAGKVKRLNELEDTTFQFLGTGLAVEPEEGKVYAPTDGTIVSVFHTKHAITMVTNSGVEYLIHMGINTVQLEGKYFKVNVCDNDKVQKGDLLAEFDIQGIRDAGYNPTTIVVVVNDKEFQEVRPMAEGSAVVGEEFLFVR